MIRYLADDDPTEVPSPTFTLMQSYDLPRFQVVHIDLYRTTGAAELAELGFDDLPEGSVVLLEWPDRAGNRLPADRLDVAITLAPKLKAEFRHARVTGHGAFAQALGHGHERNDAFGQMRDRTVGLAVTYRRAIRAARPIHQDELAVAEHQSLVAAGRGVARHRAPLRLAQAALGQEAAYRRHPLHPGREGAVTGHARVAELGLELGGERDRDVEPIGRQPVAGAVGPLEQDDAAFR